MKVVDAETPELRCGLFAVANIQQSVQDPDDGLGEVAAR
jgi:hypothetical protein